MKPSMTSGPKALLAALALAVTAGCAVGGGSLPPAGAGADSANREGGNIARALPLTTPTPSPTPTPAAAKHRGNIARALPLATPTPHPTPTPTPVKK
jgi:hypothetical protein